MEKSQNQEMKQQQPKINYQDKNLEYIEKIKEKKLREEQEKLNQQRKQQQRRQKLKRKILEEASRNRQNKEYQGNIQENKDELTPKNLTGMSKKSAVNRSKNFDSLPKIHTSVKEIDEGKSMNYKQRHLSFLKTLNQTVKSKKDIEEEEKKKKQIHYAKIKQQLGFGNVESKLASMISKPKSETMQRSQSAEKSDSMLGKHLRDVEIVDEMPKTNKNFKRKNQEYIEKIKKKRQLEQQQKEEEELKKKKLKEKLKDYVMVTVKQNVLDGMYDETDERKNRKKNQDEDQEEDDDQQSTTPSQKRKSRKLRSFPYITDLTEWKKKNRIEPEDKVFIVTGGYGDIKAALRERGWYQNPDSSSPCFDLKYTLQARQIDYDKILDFQLANHFQKAGCITTKVGLTKSLRNLLWIKDISEDNFYPKCFDLGDDDDAGRFQTHFKICKALSILKIFTSFYKQSQTSPELKKKNKGLIEDLKLRTEVALNVCKKNVEDIDDLIDRKKTIKIITEKEWEILAQDELNEESLAKKKHEEWLKSIDFKYNLESKKEKKGEKKKKKNQQSAEKSAQNADQKAEEDDQDNQEQNILSEEVQKILQEYQQKFPQFHITGHNNIWILKPAGLSRGRGITCYNNLVEIQDHIKCKQSQWIAQKYIQNPLVILKRKFDIRQWVLITDFNPLTIWLYDQCYVRFSAVDYDPKEIKNKFIHLTNNSIGAHHKKFENSHIKGNMFFQEDFSNYLQQLAGEDIFMEKVRPQIKQIVKHSMMCGMQGIQNRKNTHQLYGYDFMVDENYKVWLIQINSSPSMDYSTHVTSKLVKECLSDIIKVVVDYPAAPKKDRKNVDTGKFKRIYKGIQIPDKPITTGLNLCLEGVALKKPKRNAVKITNFSLDKK